MNMDIQCPVDQSPPAITIQTTGRSKCHEPEVSLGSGAGSSAAVLYAFNVAQVKAKAYTGVQASKQAEVKVADLSREEFESRISQNKAESELYQQRNLNSIEKTLIEIRSEIGSLRSEMVGMREGFSGKFDGVNASISTTQWMLGLILTIIGLGLALLAIPGIEKIL